MPFKKRDGNHYFEAIEAFDEIAIERHELFLALCPLCAAMYKEFVKRDESNSAAFKAALLSSQNPAVPLQLGQRQRTVRFVETHIFDLRIILNGHVVL
jgi:lipopolysaccharide biosynthesis protein